MKKVLKRAAAILICFIIAFGSLSVAADKASLQQDIAKLEQKSQKLEKEIKKLKGEKADQQKVVNALQGKISNTQAKISRCNQEMNSLNSKISANKAEIEENNKKIEKQKLEFKKRLRAIYMSNSDSNVKVLMGADNFSDFLQLSKLTSATSSRDKKIMDDIKGVIDAINAKKAENEKLLEQQVAIKNTVAAEQKALQKDENEASKILNNIAGEQKSVEKENAAVEKEIRAMEQRLQSILAGAASSSGSFINAKTGFMWPVPGYRNISSPFGYRIHPISGKSKMHNGIDISGGSIYGKPIVAVTDGVVTQVVNSCPHRDKSSRCSCGGGYGNYVVVDHGMITISGATSAYSAYYAHMNSVAVGSGQRVKQGDVLGYVGTTGQSTGYHLHFGLIKNGGWVNPSNYV